MPTFRPGFSHPFEELREEFDRLWSSLAAVPAVLADPSIRAGRRTAAATAGAPTVNVSESDVTVTVEAEVPGLDVGDIHLAATADEVVLSFVFPESRSAAAAPDGDSATRSGRPITWHRRERPTGSFERRIEMPSAIDPDRVEARLEHGVLTVTCPKSALAQPRKVEIRTS